MSKAPKRCAIYTRKSSDEGLDQQFNSLDAQREACAAFIASQASEGWTQNAAIYDDGGVSGGTMDRRGLQTLLADIALGSVDVVVVYKIDRLTRSLADFARMVELFDQHGVSFVSVTQQFNTTSSMGRLTLNVLLSFAQFEREVTGERIRDKIAASKAKGMWMGGIPPLGYDRPAPGSRTLQVNDEEASVVRRIYAAYLELGSVHRLQRWLDQHGIVSKQHTTRSGKIIGGQPLGRGALFHLLRNKTYRGMIVHKGKVHDGLHTPIVDAALFDRVQSQLDVQARRRRKNRQRRDAAPLVGRIFDGDGYPMSPTIAYGKAGKRYRYYVSAPLQQGQKQAKVDGSPHRVPATVLEAKLRTTIQSICRNQTAEALDCLKRLDVRDSTIELTLAADKIDPAKLEAQAHITASKDLVDDQALRIIVPARIRCRAGRSWIIDGTPSTKRPDPVLINALRTAHTLIKKDNAGRPKLETAPASRYDRQLVRLAFLAPDLQRCILDGRQPPGLTLQYMMDTNIPADWNKQAQMFARFYHG